MKMTRSDFAIGLLKGGLYLYSWLIVCGIWKLITMGLRVEYSGLQRHAFGFLYADCIVSSSSICE